MFTFVYLATLFLRRESPGLKFGKRKLFAPSSLCTLENLQSNKRNVKTRKVVGRKLAVITLSVNRIARKQVLKQLPLFLKKCLSKLRKLR